MYLVLLYAFLNTIEIEHLRHKRHKVIKKYEQVKKHSHIGNEKNSVENENQTIMKKPNSLREEQNRKEFLVKEEGPKIDEAITSKQMRFYEELIAGEPETKKKSQKKQRKESQEKEKENESEMPEASQAPKTKENTWRPKKIRKTRKGQPIMKDMLSNLLHKIKTSKN